MALTSVHLRQRADGGWLVEFFFLGRLYFLKSGETTTEWLFSKDHIPNVWTPLKNAFSSCDMYLRNCTKQSKDDLSDYSVSWEEAIFHIKLQLSRSRYGVSVPTKL